jgi:formylglycine-generating enzyme required for sulfatase activity
MRRLASLLRALAVVVPSLVAGLALLGPGLAQAEKGKKYALLVGVRNYDSGKFRPLKYTENDAEGLARVLGKAGFSLHVLTTTRGEKRRADAPTAANLRAAVEALLARKKRGDTVLVALAGHGIQRKVKGSGKEESYFCPSDAQLNDPGTLLALGRLFADLDDCGAGIKLLLVDACRNDPAEGRNVDIDTLPRLPRGTAALFSCSSGERAFESAKLGRGHGVFFYYVLQGLQGKAKNADGEVRWSGLAEHVTQSVSRAVPRLIGEGAQQTPEHKLNLRGASPVLIGPDGGAAAKAAEGKEEPARAPVTKGDLPGKEKVVKAGGKEITNSIGMKLVRIPAGKFTMGVPVEDTTPFSYVPQHAVEITRDYWLGVTEVTQKQFKAVMGFNPSFFSHTGKGKAGQDYRDFSKPAGGKGKVAGMSTDDFPVENVSWVEAEEFCDKLSKLPAEKRAGRDYRLPTEAEWEYACRGSASSYQPFHFGNSLSSKQANFDGDNPYGGAEKGPNLNRTCKVGQYAKNAFGLHDMHGNVWEWCADWYDLGSYSKSPRDPQGPGTGSAKVFRGGGWNRSGRYCLSGIRQSLPPTSRSLYVGFRVVMVPAGR